MLFARRLRQARDEKGFTDASLGRRMGRSRQAVHTWTSGKVFPGLAIVSELSEVLGLPSHWFFTQGELSSQERVDLEELAQRLNEASILADKILKMQRPAKK